MTEPEAKDGSLAEKISGLTQKIIGGIEEIGGVLTGDPNTIAEGEFNQEVGEIREKLDEEGVKDETK
ncbi:MAG: hypothetical protein HS105_11455 [Chloracidobacterium sp.]|nr:hypothetical protein [Chloracidobacterium sp.]MCC6824726.1 hypothetical protein [Acidobacteriota bacterium]MCO5332733.1 hypothetical protein [Pyrinomonadaceae bacterium]